MLVDSREKMLSQKEIIVNASQEIKSNYSEDQVLAAVLAESRAPNTVVMRQGNTLFFINYDPKNKYRGMFRALNADVASQYLQNSIEFIKAAGLMKMQILVSSFDDPTVLSIFKYISRRPPFPNMGYRAYRRKDGVFTAVITFNDNINAAKKPSGGENETSIKDL